MQKLVCSHYPVVISALQNTSNGAFWDYATLNAKVSKSSILEMFSDNHQQCADGVKIPQVWVWRHEICHGVSMWSQQPLHTWLGDRCRQSLTWVDLHVTLPATKVNIWPQNWCRLICLSKSFNLNGHMPMFWTTLKFQFKKNIWWRHGQQLLICKIYRVLFTYVGVTNKLALLKFCHLRWYRYLVWPMD